MGERNVEIICSACGQETLLRREPAYEGFKKVGEKLTCAACGHTYADEAAVPFKQTRRPSVFGESDRSKTVSIFREDERQNNCRYCEHYTVNPFTQRCGLHNRIVQATDSCPDFSKKEVGEEDD